MDIIATHPQFIHKKVSVPGQPCWLFTIVYGSPNPSLRKHLWADLIKSSLDLTDPWMIVGGFNAVVSTDEVSNQGKLDKRRCSGFLDWISEHQLLGMGFTGSRFTWTRRKSTNTFKGARIDRALCNMDWRFMFESTSVIHLPKLHSDHSPLLVKLQVPQAIPQHPPFRFQAAWLTHPNFDDVIRRNWKESIPFSQNISRLTTALYDWNNDKFGNVFKRKRNLWARLGGVQRKLTEKRSWRLIKLERKLQKDLEITLQEEELIWYQKSREEWMALGDKNTKFYHASTIVRRCRNKIESLKNANREWVMDPIMPKNLIQDNYKNLFEEERPPIISPP